MDRCSQETSTNSPETARSSITAYGGLRWTTTTGMTDNTSLYHFWGTTIENLDSDIVAVGAQEMARLAREAHEQQ